MQGRTRGGQGAPSPPPMRIPTLEGVGAYLISHLDIRQKKPRILDLGGNTFKAFRFPFFNHLLNFL